MLTDSVRYMDASSLGIVHILRLVKIIVFLLPDVCFYPSLSCASRNSESSSTEHSSRSYKRYPVFFVCR